MKKNKLILSIGIVVLFVVMVIITVSIGLNKKSTYTWDGTLKGYLQYKESFIFGDVEFGDKYEDVIKDKTILNDGKGKNAQSKNYSVTAKGEKSFSDINVKEPTEMYFFSKEEDKLVGVALSICSPSGVEWTQYNEELNQYFKKHFLGYTLKEESGQKEEGVDVIGRQTYEDSKGNRIVIEYGSVVTITVNFAK